MLHTVGYITDVFDRRFQLKLRRCVISIEKNTVCILTNPYFCTNLHVCSKTNRNTNQMIPLKICMCWAIQKGNDSVIRICNHKKRSKQFNWHKHWWWCSVLPMLVYSSGNGLSEFLKNKKKTQPMIIYYRIESNWFYFSLMIIRK